MSQQTQREILTEEINKLKIELKDVDCGKVTKLNMDRLHKYNDVKDIAQMLFGILATTKETTTKEIYKEFNISLDD
jgi:phosphoribosylformylglycinamidine (FGAM) synthase PurS component